ncbi:MAG: sensor histidine kinase [Pseudonocardiales bacterium]|nr:sensor histidine kinase [Pseudonocardiales bacterium]
MTETIESGPTADGSSRPRKENPLLLRLRLTGLGWFYKLLFPVAIVLFCLTVTFIPLVLIGVGIVFVLTLVPVLQAYSSGERLLAGSILGTRIETYYKPRTGGGPMRLLRTWATDPARWKDLLLLPIAFSAGFVLVILVDTFFLAGLFYLVYPYLYALTPKGTFDQTFGIWQLDSQSRSFAMWIFAALALVIWWYITPGIMKARALIARGVLSPSRAALERRVREVAQSRAETVDYSAAELRRIERDLHDGAQARLVSLGMSLGLAEDLVHRDPEAAIKLLLEARLMTTSALGDLRTVVRGIHPPVLADRGLGGAVQALALDLAVPIAVTVDLPGRAPAPVESAAYFAVAECLANVVKHSRAEHAWVALSHDHGRLHITVTDDGRGGADARHGTGLDGMVRRLAAFDGTVEVDSPNGGPTVVTLELPCELSQPAPTINPRPQS